MKVLTWTTDFGGETQTYCQLVIEEIIITSPADREVAARLTELNHHNEVRKIALKYTQNELLKQVVTRISELEKADLIPLERAEHQELVRFTQHFRIIY